MRLIAADVNFLQSTFRQIANAVRQKSGKSGSLTVSSEANEIATEIAALPEDCLDKLLRNRLYSYENAAVTEIPERFFRNRDCLRSVSFPAVTKLESYIFAGCTALQSASFPALQSFEGTYVFQNCALTEFITGTAFDSRIMASTFNGCSALEKVDFNHIIAATGIFANALKCINLETVIIRNTDEVPKLASNALSGATKIVNGTGYIYVPESMVDLYKEATNWSVYADQIRAIEDYPEITGGTA